MHPNSNYYNHPQMKKGKFSLALPFISKYSTPWGAPASCQLGKNITRELKSAKGHFDLRGGLG